MADVLSYGYDSEDPSHLRDFNPVGEEVMQDAQQAHGIT